MNWQGVYVSSAAVELPRLVPVTEAVADGSYPEEEAARTGMRSVSVSERAAAPELAVAAARAALAASPVDPASVGLLIHADCYFQGVEFWNTAAFVQHHALGHGDATAFELRQMSNGGMCALEVAAGLLTARPDLGAALVTTGDRFGDRGFDRWRTDKGLVFADGGTAVVLTREPGPLRLVATASHAAPELEGLHRGAGFPAGFEQARTVDLLARKESFLTTTTVGEVTARNEAGMMTAVKRCLSDADADVDAMALVAVPFFGAGLVARQCLEPLGVDADRTLADWGLTTGHLGSGDQAAALAKVLADDLLRPGERVLLVGVGAGFTWTCAVLERC
ncbi:MULTISPECIES: ketoacyl-ACP synthase III family protein [Actinosynnema]|uniref:ketoacyl-ACP synthase III family protein n=1 Tax=Actinosynnema TaxID=40566 RepID=UPI0020A47FFA|nr:ketoacyl-ACP synthase III family protein [Actinosynnema pretiosum]MCP2094787.1 3-oxoacyl-[acyl-carrier-protein] synthase-3 [Actinosynnema pretiosum]